jgi:hypothetical protein
MVDREKVKKGLECCKASTNDDPFQRCSECPYNDISISVQECRAVLSADALELLKEQSSIMGTRVTADGITFISTGTAQAGEARGLLLGKMAMHEWLKKELFYRGLLTDEIRAVFDEAERR